MANTLAYFVPNKKGIVASTTDGLLENGEKKF
jgi:hypothetical protein